jgi:dienelactone hydrolase
MFEFARTHGLALMGTQLAFADTVPEFYARVLEAIRTVSNLSGRDELASAAIAIHGFALGGCVAYGMAATHPDRVMGFIAEKGGLCLHHDGAPANTVAGYLIYGALDPTVGVESGIRSAFERNRARGAPWAFGIEWDGGHTLLRNHDLLFNWLSDVVTRRTPDVITPGAPVTLRLLDQATGWLGDLSTFVVAGWSCYTANKNTASWFPSERTAKDWQGMISRGTTTTIIRCGG